jgi:octaprenyl-diphosphate synthase
MFSDWDEYHLIDNKLAELARSLPESDLGEVVSYILRSPGKRVRPLILIFSAQAFGAKASQAIDAAIAIELVHAASLVHDDILDYGVERRGSQSSMKRFGPEASLLAGDYLISQSIELISGFRQPVISCFARACMNMSEGEMLDLSSACAPEDYYSCVSKKTASLFAASAKIGCLMACALPEDVSLFESYGMHLGLAYQILDDLEESLGIEQGKASEKTSVTLPRIYGSLCPETALQMCIQAIDHHRSLAKEALRESSADMGMKARLDCIIDEMTCQGLDRCRSQKSLC